MPELASVLLDEYRISHNYNTRQISFRHPAINCEIEKRALPYQLITLYEKVPHNILSMDMIPSLRE